MDWLLRFEITYGLCYFGMMLAGLIAGFVQDNNRLALRIGRFYMASWYGYAVIVVPFMSARGQWLDVAVALLLCGMNAWGIARATHWLREYRRRPTWIHEPSAQDVMSYYGLPATDTP